MKRPLAILGALAGLAVSIGILFDAPDGESFKESEREPGDGGIREAAPAEGTRPPGAPPDPVRAACYLDLDRPIRFGIDLSVEILIIEGGETEATFQQDWLLETRLRGSPSEGRGVLVVDSMRRGIEIPQAREGLPQTVPSRQLSFSLDPEGHVSEFTLEPDADFQTRSFIRSLARLHVPAVLAADRRAWAWESGALDLVGELTRCRWNPGRPPRLAEYDMTSEWQVVEREGEHGPWPVLDVQHFEAFPFGEEEISRIYRGSFLLARDGFPLAGEAHYARKSGILSEYHGCLIRAWIVREGIGIDPESRAKLMARGDAIYAALLEKVPPRGTPSPFSEAEYLAPPERPAPKFPLPIRTATVGDLLLLFASISSNREHQEYLAVLHHVGELASQDPMLRDRLLQIVEEGWGTDVRQIAIYALGYTELPEVRARLLDLVEAEELDLALRITALRATYMSRTQGLWHSEGRIVSYLHPIHDRAALERVLGLSERTDLPRRLVTEGLLPALGTSQLAYPEGVDNPFSTRLRDLSTGLEDPEVIKLAVNGLWHFPSQANFRFMTDMYLAMEEWDKEGVKDAFLGAFKVSGVEDPVLARSLNGMLLDLASRTPTLGQRARIFQKIAGRSVDQDGFLALAREGLLGAMRPLDRPGSEFLIRRSFIQNMTKSVSSGDEEFIGRARDLLVEAREHYARESELARMIDAEIAGIDRSIRSMREQQERRKAEEKREEERRKGFRR